MTKSYKASLITVFVYCILLCNVVTAQTQNKKGFRWEEVQYNGQTYISLRSLKAFYYFDEMSFGSSVTLKNRQFKMVVKSGSQQCYLNGVLFVLSYPVVSKNGRYLLHYTDLVKLIDPVLRPASIANARAFDTVVVDAGHGGYDSGARGVFGDEETYTLKVAKLLRDKLQAKRYKVVMTRATDTYVSRGNRVAIANRYPNAVFISLHFNSARSSAATGIETFTVSPVGVPHMGRGVRAGDYKTVPGNMMDSASIALATAIHGHSLLYLNDSKRGKNFKMIDRGIKRARFDVLQGIRIPAVLLEGGFISNRREAANVNSAGFQETLSDAVVRAVDLYRGAILKGARR